MSTLAAVLASVVAPQSGMTAGRVVAHGMYQAGAPDLAAVRAFDQLVGKRVAVVSWFQAWGNDQAFHAPAVAALLNDGRTPLVTWEPWDWRAGADQAPYSLRAIASGAHDAYITSWAQAAGGLPGVILLRFAHEANGSWYPWSVGGGQNTAADYVAAFQHVVSVFRAQGATNVRFVWSVNVAYSGSAPLGPLYPGDAYVDWVGIDGYNWGTNQAGKSWQTFDQVFGPTYDDVVALAPGKRLLISEVASTELGGNKAQWITDALSTSIPSSFGRVEAIVWFNENKETDWRVNSSSASLAAYGSAVRPALYTSSLQP